jgi:hypothetical protein
MAALKRCATQIDYAAAKIDCAPRKSNGSTFSAAC